MQCGIVSLQPIEIERGELGPGRAVSWFEDCRAASARGNRFYVQIPCQPLSFDFTMANAYPFHSHDAFADIKAADRARLTATYRDPGWRACFRADLAAPKVGTIFKGDWDQVFIAAAARAANEPVQNRTIAELAAERASDPLDAMLDLALGEDLETAFLGKFLNVGDDGLAPLLRHDSGVISLSDAGAHLIYMCEAGYGLHLLSHWVRERGDFTLAEAIRRLTSHPAELYGIRDRGRLRPGAWADMMLFNPATVGVGEPHRVADLPAGGRRAIREPRGVRGVWVNGTQVHDGADYADAPRGPGQVLRDFAA